MNWAEERKRIRRALRDPDGHIWSDALLRRLYNDVQREFQAKTSVLEDVETVRVPPMYLSSYMHDWEWTYAGGAAGKAYKALFYLDQISMVGTQKWELETAVGYGTDEDFT